MEEDRRGKAKRIDTTVRSYGNSSYVLPGKEINKAHNNLLISIVGKVPFLEIDLALNKVRYWGAEPAVVVVGQNMPRFETGGAILTMIDPSSVESIGFTKPLGGRPGIIVVYLKQDAAEEVRPPDFQSIKIEGYPRPRSFVYPDYSNPATDKTKPDYRATIYWNPEIVTDAKTGTGTVSFFAADLPGRYRIVAEGVTQNGGPVRCVYFIEVDSD